MARRPRLTPIGAHVPATKGIATGGLAYAERVGAEAVQVFLSNPRGWAPSAGKPAEDAAFAERTVERGIPSFVHAPYLVNVGSPDPVTYERSVACVAHALRRAHAIVARGVVVHTGSAVTAAHRPAAFGQIRDGLLPLLDQLPDDGPDLLLEPTAGGGEPLCARVDDLTEYLAALDDHPRVGVCLDTCHVFAAGHDLTADGGVAAMLRALTHAAGKGRLRLVHANDSKDPAGSLRDRHENVGGGTLGTQPFADLLNHPTARGVPFIVETPGDADRCAADIDTLKGLR
ncbi:MAG: deoxyribonuclease IV [Streptosporangiales bacterium]|nr:deoxyribonuclease IV [Streptosporangiales bacterium]